MTEPRLRAWAGYRTARKPAAARAVRRRYGRLRPALEPVRLPRSTELEAANEEVKFVYFPTSGVASIVATDERGESVDTAMIGREGMTGSRRCSSGPISPRSGRSCKCR